MSGYKFPPVQIGSAFTRLTVIGERVKVIHGTKWPCRCECGAERLVYDQHLRQGVTTSCGCLKADMVRARHAEYRRLGVKRIVLNKADLTGQRFNRWLVIDEAPQAGKERRWNCICDCGVKRAVFQQHLKRGMSKSCGCLSAELLSERSKEQSTTHGYYGTPTYRTWQAMKQRGLGKVKRKDYADRGIALCESWHSFENFLADMGERPEGKSLDRIDNNKGYYLENCRWADNKTQCRNKGNNRVVDLNGESITAVEMAERHGINYITLLSRLKRGMSAHEAVTKPVQKRIRKAGN